MAATDKGLEWKHVVVVEEPKGRNHPKIEWIRSHLLGTSSAVGSCKACPDVVRAEFEVVEEEKREKERKRKRDQALASATRSIPTKSRQLTICEVVHQKDKHAADLCVAGRRPRCPS